MAVQSVMTDNDHGEGAMKRTIKQWLDRRAQRRAEEQARAQLLRRARFAADLRRSLRQCAQGLASVPPDVEQKE